MEGRLLLDVIVTQSATILELLSCENETLLVGRDSGDEYEPSQIDNEYE